MHLPCPTRIASVAFAVLLGWTFPSGGCGETVLDVGAEWNYLRKICFSPDGHVIAAAVDVGDRKSVIALWNRATGERIAQFEIAGHDLHHLLFSPDGRRLVSAQASFGNRRCRIWNLEKKTLEHRLVDDTVWISNVAFSTDGERLVTGNADRTLKW